MGEMFSLVSDLPQKDFTIKNKKQKTPLLVLYRRLIDYMVY